MQIQSVTIGLLRPDNNLTSEKYAGLLEAFTLLVNYVP